MSRFYGSLRGGRGEATREGHAATGINGHIRGWDLGVRVDGFAVERAEGRGPERDGFDVTVTGGSHGNRPSTPLLRVEEDGDGIVVTMPGRLGGHRWSFDRSGNVAQAVAADA